MKLSITIALLFIASCIFAQSVDQGSRTTKIDEKEKRRIENQYKSLTNFYVDDDGLVVYQPQSNSSTENLESSSSSKAVQTESNINDSQYSSEKTEKTSTTKVVSKIDSPDENSVVANDKSPVRPAIIKKEVVKISEVSSVDKSTDKEDEVDLAVKKKTVVHIEENDVDGDLEVKTVKTTKTEKKESKKTSVFDKKKYTPQYKTMEEAALAVEALLEELKKDQVKSTGAGSMSSRLSGGAGRATLRKKPASNLSFSTVSTSSNSRENNAFGEVDLSTSEFGYHPTYYINGKEVEKVEVDRLRKKEIITKEVRTRNTASGNPNGEIWYEVKYDN